MGNLLYLVAVILVILWLVGMFVPGVGGYGMGNLLWILLVLAIVAVLLRVISGRSV